jgi:signal transduction histidine kinase
MFYVRGEINKYYQEFPLYDAAGKLIWYAHWGRVSRRDEQGRALRISGLSMNIHKRKQAEQELRESHRQLEELNARLVELDRLKSHFLSMVSHELRTPLTSLLGFAKLVRKTFVKHFEPLALESGNLRGQGRRISDNLDIIALEGARLSRMINDLLDLSKIQSGRMEWRDTVVSPAHSLRRAVDAVHGLYLQKPAVTLEVAVDEDAPDIRIDPDRLEQVIINLLNNAWKFTDDGVVRITLSAVNGYLRVAVADTGRGIPTAELEDIFSQFHQVDRGDTLAAVPRGTGLGLAICREIVEHYHGRIWAESEEGRGATFVVDLPVEPRARR